MHTYEGVQDVDTLNSQPVSTTNIVVEIVHYTIGPYSEHGVGAGDVQSELVGSGSGYVLRDGISEKVTWSRPSQLSKTTFTNAKGQAVALAPGRTWVELVPDVQASGIALKK
jgi:hypothetical protein